MDCTCQVHHVQSLKKIARVTKPWDCQPGQVGAERGDWGGRNVGTWAASVTVCGEWQSLTGPGPHLHRPAWLTVLVHITIKIPGPGLHHEMGILLAMPVPIYEVHLLYPMFLIHCLPPYCDIHNSSPTCKTCRSVMPLYHTCHARLPDTMPTGLSLPNGACLALLDSAGQVGNRRASKGMEGVQEGQLKELGHPTPYTPRVAAEDAHQVRIFSQPSSQPPRCSGSDCVLVPPCAVWRLTILESVSRGK